MLLLLSGICGFLYNITCMRLYFIFSYMINYRIDIELRLILPLFPILFLPFTGKG